MGRESKALFTCGAVLLGFFLGLVTVPSEAWILPLSPGSKQLFLQVGVGTASANNPAVNVVSVSVPAGAIGDGTPLVMTSDSTQAASPYDGYAVCNPPSQVYVGGSYRQPNNSASGAAAATLQVSTPSALTNGSDTIPFSQISWTSTANGNATADIPAGTFNGGTVALTTIGRNFFVENCFIYSYLNQNAAAAGTFSGRAVFTLAVP